MKLMNEPLTRLQLGEFFTFLSQIKGLTERMI